MKITSIKTHKIKPFQESIFDILDRYLKKMKEESLLVVTSKIISICQGRVVEAEGTDKMKLIIQEAEYYLPPEKNKYNITLTIKNNLLAATAGIDESNSFGYFVLLPENPQKIANQIKKYLINRFSLKKVGVIITDSKSSLLRQGTTGVALAHSGFLALNNYIGQTDICGRKLKVSKANVLDALAVSAVLVMGEGKEQTPLSLIEDIPFIKFQKRNPSQKELEGFYLEMKNDYYYPLYKNVKWKKGKAKNKIF